MLEVGLTVTVPEVAPPVLKPVPEQVVALLEDQMIVTAPPEVIEVGLTEMFAVGDGGGIALHILISTSQEEPLAQVAPAIPAPATPEANKILLLRRKKFLDG